MVEFRTEYYTSMDRAYHDRAEMAPIRSDANIEQPITVADLGQTVPEHDPSGRFKNILQNVQAAIRGGTGNLQLVFQTPIESAIGGRPKSYGEEVRTAIREVAMASDVKITGMEMPTSLTNMSGWDAQRGIIDEEKRRRDLNEVKEMVQFAAEVGRGGGVDIVAWEYDRPVHRAAWLDDKSKKAFSKAIEHEKEKEVLSFVDKRSGSIMQIPIREGIPMFIKSGSWDPIPYDQEPETWNFDKFKGYAQHKLQKKDVSYDQVADFIMNNFLDEQLNQAYAQEGYYRERLNHTREQLQMMKDRLPSLRGEEAEAYKKRIKEQSDIVGFEELGVREQKRVQQQFKDRKKNLTPMEVFVLDKSAQSYAEAGMEAMNTQHKLGPKVIQKDLYVGPEIGWPQYYGSHPQEFVQIIMNARQKMEGDLLKKGFTHAQAEEQAKRHIKGTFDTSHVGMWLQDFHPEMAWDKRVPAFNKWYKEQVEWLAKENLKHDIIGGIQAVDSAGAGHGHLPPGQGILPVKEAVEILRNKGGYTGYVTSEGHEEEKFGEGRILLKSWQKFNAPISGNYMNSGAPQRWGNIQQGYFGRTYSPNFMFGAYAPSNEFKLWSDVPLE